MKLRRALAGSTLSLLAVLATVAPATAADPACDDTVALQASVDAARATLTDAEAAFHAANRPLGQLVSAQRHAAKAELSQSRTALHELTRQLRGRQSAEARLAVPAQVRVERREAAAARSLLTSKRALLAEIKADRSEARTTLRTARTALESLETAQESCGTPATEG
jgi:chromosome condensin MukBEF ATPase and DNA-binding subunit MukB